jgi:hypothetical protein
MKGLVLAAGWPFAGLLALDTGRAEGLGAAPVRGLIVEADGESGVFILEAGDLTCALVTDPTTRCFGVDGYPIARGDIRVGDMVDTVRQKNGEEWLTTQIRLLRLGSPRIPAWIDPAVGCSSSSSIV